MLCFDFCSTAYLSIHVKYLIAIVFLYVQKYSSHCDFGYTMVCEMSHRLVINVLYHSSNLQLQHLVHCENELCLPSAPESWLGTLIACNDIGWAECCLSWGKMCPEVTETTSIRELRINFVMRIVAIFSRRLLLYFAVHSLLLGTLLTKIAVWSAVRCYFLLW